MIQRRDGGNPLRQQAKAKAKGCFLDARNTADGVYPGCGVEE